MLNAQREVDTMNHLYRVRPLLSFKCYDSPSAAIFAADSTESVSRTDFPKEPIESMRYGLDRCIFTCADGAMIGFAASSSGIRTLGPDELSLTNEAPAEIPLLIDDSQECHMWKPGQVVASCLGRRITMTHFIDGYLFFYMKGLLLMFSVLISDQGVMILHWDESE